MFSILYFLLPQLPSKLQSVPKLYKPFWKPLIGNHIMIFGTPMVLYDYHRGILNRMFSQETITDVHLYLDCLNFNCCLVGNFNETHLSTLKVLRSNFLFVNF